MWRKIIGFIDRNIIYIGVFIAACYLSYIYFWSSSPKIEPIIYGHESRPIFPNVKALYAKDGQFPYVVSLRNISNGGEKHFCGGSIIDQLYILTAAHCFDTKIKPQDFQVAAGTIYSDSSKANYSVESYLTHPNYDNFTRLNNIAIIKLKKPIEFTRHIRKISLYNNLVPPSVYVTFAGWWKSEDNQDLDYNLLLQYSHAVNIPLAVCKHLLYDNKPITLQHICTFEENISFCYGHDGGPLVFSGMQVGVMSWTVDNCTLGYPNVHTRVSSYGNWIQSAIKKLK